VKEVKYKKNKMKEKVEKRMGVEGGKIVEKKKGGEEEKKGKDERGEK
jgi:hypothetical protein